MGFGKRRPFNACAICAHDIKSAQCPHPWYLPFQKWSNAVLAQLKQLAPHGWDTPQ